MKPVALVILDGWGWREVHDANAVLLAQTPHFDRYWREQPGTFLTTCGEAVGLPAGVMGNSEVGHLNIGAGRIVYQDLSRIHRAIGDGTFVSNARLQEAFARICETGTTLHCMGLLSDGGVHSHIDHLVTILQAAHDARVPRVVLHLFLDGRDTSPTGGAAYLQRVEHTCTALGNARVGTVQGRYFAMDRDRRWERTKRAYRALVEGVGTTAAQAGAAVEASYAAGVTDEFVEPTIIRAEGGPAQSIGPADTVLCCNFRGDRARQIVRALADAAFAEFARPFVLPTSQLLCMTSYHQDFAYPTLFPPVAMTDLLQDVMAAHGKTQLRIAETEKYAHVTFFFNGGRDSVVVGERHRLIQSPKDVATYDEKPEMSAREVTRVLLDEIASDCPDLVICNFANPDMVGHTGDIDAAVRAVETVDACLGQVVEAVVARGGAAVVTADHGNCEEMRTADGLPHTAHTTNPVPCFLAGATAGTGLRDGGILADIAPTLLALLAVPQPAAMTGVSLLTHA